MNPLAWIVGRKHVFDRGRSWPPERTLQTLHSAWLAICLLAMPAAASTQKLPDDELKAHLELLQRKVEDPTSDISVRETFAMEMAATLDRAAQAATSAEARRARWGEAVAALDRFQAGNPKHALQRQFAVQAAVYVWASARTWLQASRLQPNDASARKNAVDGMSDAVKRLQPVVDALGAVDDVFAQNARYRLAQALTDLAEVTADDAESRRARNIEALAPLGATVTEPSLQGFAHLLRATLLTRLARYDEAKAALDAAAKATPPPPEPDIVEARVALLLGLKRFYEAMRAVDASKLDAAAKPLVKIRALLAQRAEAPAGRERQAAEARMFDELKAFRDSRQPEARAALIAAASAVSAPDAGQQAFAWDLLAEGALALGDLPRAAALEVKAGDRAEMLADLRLAADSRLKAGAYFYQAERFDQADPLLTKVAEDPNAGPSRPKAGLLRALARGRALAKKSNGASQAAYVDALKFQVKTFPDDPATAEARWLLGKLKLASGDRDEAETLWKALPHDSPRWLDARLEIAALQLADLNAQRLNNDRSAVRDKHEAARSFLARSIDEAQGDQESQQLQLGMARLELTPGSGRPELALKALDEIQRSVSRSPERDAARRLNLVALLQTSRWIEAEQAARAETRVSEPAELIEMVRLIDRSAAEADSDLKMRRMGLVLRLLLARINEAAGNLTPEVRAEVRLRSVRALLFSGDEEAARRQIATWTEPPPSSTNDLLRDLAESYSRLGAHRLAEDVQRLRARRSTTGSLAWFDARYGLALAYFRSGKLKDALHLIDATAILHPDLGGGELHEKFLKLRQRIDTKD